MGEPLYENQNEPETKVNGATVDEKEKARIEAAVGKLMAEIKGYHQAVIDAEAALDSAEEELSEVLYELPE